MNDKITLNTYTIQYDASQYIEISIITSKPFETVGNRVYQGFWSYFNRSYWLRGITMNS